MIEVHDSFDGSQLVFSVRGHAGAAPKGEDLICAAATILARALGETVKGDKHLRIQDGEFVLRCEPTAENMAYFNVIDKGFVLLEKQYPEYIKIF